MRRQSHEAALVEDFTHSVRRVRYQLEGLSITQAAEIASYSRTTLKRVQSGQEGIPPEEPVLALIAAFGGNTKWWRRQHRDLVSGCKRGTPVGPFYPAPEVEFTPEAIRSVRDLAIDMNRLRVLKNLSLRNIEASIQNNDRIASRMGGETVSLKTLSDLCNPNQGGLASTPTLFGFALAVGIEEEGIEALLDIRANIARKRRSRSTEPSCC